MSVYTRTGDKGKTSLYQGKRVLKSDLRIEAIGNVDELNSILGISIAELRGQSLIKGELINVQKDLFEIGANLANPSSKLKNLEQKTRDFERLIDDLTAKLPQLNNFILPGGSLGGSHLHLARTICRRAERRVVELSQKDPSAGSGLGSIIVYLNRLSDLLFMIARFINYKEKKKEIVWAKR